MALVACERATGAAEKAPVARVAPMPQPVSTAATPVSPAANVPAASDLPFMPEDATDSLFLRTLPDRLEHLLFAHWQSEPTDSECGEDNPDGYPIFALRGLGRIRVLRMIALSPEAVRGAMSMPVAPDSSFHVPKRVDTVLEVAHVISYEGAMASPYDNVEREPVVSVRPVTDTITVSWARFTDSWRRCGDAWTQPPRSEAIGLIGPRFASDSIAPALYRRVTPNATVARASELADSIARAGSAMDLGALAGAPRR